VKLVFKWTQELVRLSTIWQLESAWGHDGLPNVHHINIHIYCSPHSYTHTSPCIPTHTHQSLFYLHPHHNHSHTIVTVLMPTYIFI